MNGFKKIAKKYNWNRIGVWSAILAGCISTMICLVVLLISGCTRACSNLSAPATITDAALRAEYLAIHYWDNFNFSDTTLIHQPEITEQAFVDFIVVLPHVAKQKATEGINTLLSKAEKEETGRMYQHFLELSEKYLYDPNSPLRNEELYIPVTQYILQDTRTGETERIRPAHRLNMMLKNRVGEKAGNFTYTLSNGQSKHLSDIKSEYTLLFFHNPDCALCREVSLALKTSPIVNNLLGKGTLSLLALYPDEDLSIWRKHLNDMPQNWINAYDKGTIISKKELYDLKAMPTLYLLNQEKHVVLKDVDFATMETWLLNSFPMLPQ
ncbi:DUF5106 domain-containing protein [Parabacteroides sp. OttesenSCG-928-K15]|nr:DUF5106 domain-containing protein [Parabacteroides sp. OttesenSCG-928-K15]